MPEALSVHDLAYIRSMQVDLLPDTCTIQTRTETQDAYGGVALSWTTTYSNVECRLDQVRGGPIVAANWMCTMPWDQPFTMDDRILTTELTLEPVEINTGKSWETATRAWCRNAAD